MKKYCLASLLLAIVFTLSGQAPALFNFQAVARDASGNVISDQNVNYRISVLGGSDTGTPLYTETHLLQTNQFGLSTLVIGTGANKTGSLENIAWDANSYYLKIELDITGGSSFEPVGTSRLYSVPYALNAKSAAGWVSNEDITSTKNKLTVGGTTAGTYLNINRSSIEGFLTGMAFFPALTLNYTSTLPVDIAHGGGNVYIAGSSIFATAEGGGGDVYIGGTNEYNGGGDVHIAKGGGAVTIGEGGGTVTLGSGIEPIIIPSPSDDGGFTFRTLKICDIVVAEFLGEQYPPIFGYYPSGFNKENTRVLSFEFWYNDESWRGPKDGLYYDLTDDFIYITFPDKAEYSYGHARMILMRVE